jgi:DNA-binding transcriptional regulator YiaG
MYPNIDAERARHKMTISELASILKVTRKTVYNWISRGKIPQEALEKMAKMWHVTIEYLLDDLITENIERSK